MTADETKIKHYASSYQHWNLVLKCGLGYLEGCTTKYVVRWRKKNGIGDLRKGLHYLNKLQETVTIASSRPLSYEETVREVAAFGGANTLSYLEQAYVLWLCTWRVKEDLDAAREVLFFLLDEAEALLLKQGAKPVPLTEENHHAERHMGV
jgi:hypothetical protein